MIEEPIYLCYDCAKFIYYFNIGQINVLDNNKCICPIGNLDVRKVKDAKKECKLFETLEFIDVNERFGKM